MSEHNDKSTLSGTRRSSKPVIQEDPLAWLTEDAPVEMPAPVSEATQPAQVGDSLAAVVGVEVDEVFDDKSWGLFDEPQGDESPAGEQAGDDASWGLFTEPSCDADTSWGLFDESAPSDAGGLDLGDSLLLPNVAERHRDILIRLREGALEVNAGNLERIDAAGLQLLCTVVKSERQIGRAVRWSAVSSVLAANAADLGLLDALGLEAA